MNADELFEVLLKKTRELDHKVTFSEASQDENFPNPNEFATVAHFRSFTDAAEEAFRVYLSEKSDTSSTTVEESKEKPAIVFEDDGEDDTKEVEDVSKIKKLDKEREAYVIDQIVDMYIREGGKVPTYRKLKKNRFITEAEVDYLRRTGFFIESKIRRLAEEKTGQSFDPKRGDPSAPTGTEIKPVEKETEVVAEEQGVIEESEATEEVIPEEIKETVPEEAEETIEEVIPEEVVEDVIEDESEATEETSAEESVEETIEEAEDATEEVEEVTEADPEKDQSIKCENKNRTRYTDEEIEELFRTACEEAGHILTQKEVHDLSIAGKLPAWATLKKRLYPWHLWSKRFNLPFANDASEIAAETIRKSYEREHAHDNSEAAETVESSNEDAIIDTDVIVEDSDEEHSEEEPEESFAEEDVYDDEEAGEDDSDSDESDDEDLEEDEDEEAEDEAEEIEMVEVPIKLIIPKGIKGTVKIKLKF